MSTILLILICLFLVKLIGEVIIIKTYIESINQGVDSFYNTFLDLSYPEEYAEAVNKFNAETEKSALEGIQKETN